MTGKSGRKRVEPSFEGSGRARGAALSLDESDRVVQPRRKKPAAGTSRKARPKAARRRGRGFFGLVRSLAYWSIVLGIWAGIAGIGLVAFYGAKMPSATTWEIPDRPPNVRITAVDGTLVANRGMTGGQAVGLHEMSPHIAKAVIAIEDRRFYAHFGVDPLGLARAMVENVVEGRISQGGSTLTQQLAKNLFLQPDRTIERKVQEVLLALWLEQKHTKDQILEMYLNRVYFGSGAYGVEAASQRYFNKSARDVTLAEAALLAGLLKAPSRLSPARDPRAAEDRAQIVLAAMAAQGMVGDREMATAMSAPATRAAAYWTGSEHYVADRIMQDLPELIGEVRTDVVVESTIDMSLQKLAEQSIRRLIDENGKKMNVSQGALVAIDATGAVRAMVGGRDYATSQFDRASEARRQPGSTFKPFVYMTALEQGRTPDSVRNDAPIRIGKWSPENYKGKYYGRVTLAQALAKSLNSVSAQLVMETGHKAVIETAHRMGIESKLQANASIALGTSEVTPLELTAAYVPFANGGYRPDIHFVKRVTTTAGKVLYDWKSPKTERVASPQIIGMMNSMMQGAVETGTATRAAFGWPAAGKTGTSQNSRDAWFIGYTANLTTGVWFGNDDGKPTNAVTGGTLPAMAWNEFMTAAHQGVPMRNLPTGWSRPAPEPKGLIEQLISSGGSDPSESAPATPVAAAPATRPQQGSDQTSSIRRPQGDVGAPPPQRQGSIMDIILGN